VKIAVVGCGAVGSFYGAKLIQAGQEVHFLLRSDYQIVRERGVQIYSPQGDFHVRPACATVPAQIGPCDLVVIGLKTTANDQFGALRPPLVAPQTRILTMQNGLGNESSLARLFPTQTILGGLCFVCLNRSAPGIIQHIDHGMVMLGEYQRPPQPPTHELAAILRGSRVPCHVTENLERAHWEKLVWNIPFNGLGVASAAGYDSVWRGELKAGARLDNCLTTDLLLADPAWQEVVKALMRETITIARALGFLLPDSLIEEHLARTRTMGAYKASTVIDFESGKTLELDSLFLRPLRAAQEAGLQAPRLAALSAVLKTIGAAETVRPLGSGI
jgi:2-dehydropantoate 2-reductase